MTIASEITNYANGLSDAYDAVNDMQGVIPQDKNMNNLDTAIRTIPQSTGPTYTAGTGIDITNDVISATNTGKAKVLTTADYNWNSTSKNTTPPLNTVALWLLDSGVYVNDYSNPVQVAVDKNNYGTSYRGLFIVENVSESNRIQFYYMSVQQTPSWRSVIKSNGTNGGVKYLPSLIDNLTSSSVYDALSANQGRVLKNLIDGLLISGAGAPTTSTAGTVGKLYEDTTNGKLYICTDATNPYVWEEVGGGATYTAGNGISIDANNEISIDDTVVAEVSDLPTDFTGATSSTAGANGLVPAPSAGDEGKALHGDGTWKDTTAKLVEMSYGEANSWAKFIAAYNAGSIVYCRASSNANPATGSQTRKAFMAYVNNATSPTSVEFQYVRSQSSKSASQQCDQVFVYKLTNSNGGTWSVESRDMGPKIVTGTGMSSSFTTGANATITLNAEPNYSTSEVDTKVKWIDGSTIYRKTINFGALPNATTKTVAHGISNLYRVVKFECLAYNPTSGTNTPIPLVSVVGNNSTVDISDTSIIMNTGVDRSSFTECYITLYYTKSS